MVMSVNLREQLLALDQMDPRSKAELDRRIREMTDRDLTRLERISFPVAAVMGFIFFLGFGFAAIMAIRAGLPGIASAMFAVGSVFGLAFAIFMVHVLRKGKLDRKKMPNTYTGLIWAFSIIQFVLFFQLAHQV